MRGLEVFTTDDEHVRERLSLRDRNARRVDRLEADIAVRVRHVPVEGRLDAAARHIQTDDAGAIWRLLRMRLHHVGDRSVGAHADRIGRDRKATFDLYLALLSGLNSRDMRPAVNPPTARCDRLG